MGSQRLGHDWATELGSIRCAGRHPRVPSGVPWSPHKQPLSLRNQASRPVLSGSFAGKPKSLVLWKQWLAWMIRQQMGTWSHMSEGAQPAGSESSAALSRVWDALNSPSLTVLPTPSQSLLPPFPFAVFGFNFCFLKSLCLLLGPGDACSLWYFSGLSHATH